MPISRAICRTGEGIGRDRGQRNREHPERKVHIRCRCGSGSEVSIDVTDQGKGFDFANTARNGLSSDTAAEHGRGVQLMRAYINKVHSERGGSKVHMCKRARQRSVPTENAIRRAWPSKSATFKKMKLGSR